MKPDKMNDVLPSGHVKIFKYKQATTWLNKITASKEEIEEHDRLILSLEDRINHFKPLIKKIVTDSALYKMANYQTFDRMKHSEEFLSKMFFKMGAQL